jgi:hypothetical protein
MSNSRRLAGGLSARWKASGPQTIAVAERMNSLRVTMLASKAKVENQRT